MVILERQFPPKIRKMYQASLPGPTNDDLGHVQVAAGSSKSSHEQQ